MKEDYQDLRTIEFAPLSEVKAKLSEYVRRLRNKRVALTTNGRPSAVLMSYEDYLKWLEPSPRLEGEPPAQRISLSDWRKERKNRESVRDSILDLFDPAGLSRKGQKGYKKRLVGIYRDSGSQKKAR